MNKEDILFYTDLVYLVKRLAKLSNVVDDECERRIVIRQKDIESKSISGETVYQLSDFNIALFSFVRSIAIKAGCVLRSPRDLCNHQELVEDTIKDFYLKIADDYSETPGGRYIDDGPFSGEDFRDHVLIPKYLSSRNNNHKLIVDFDGGYGYSTGFLEETFGGMIRKGHSLKDILEYLLFISDEEPNVIADVITYMEDEEIRLAKKKK